MRWSSTRQAHLPKAEISMSLIMRCFIKTEKDALLGRSLRLWKSRVRIHWLAPFSHVPPRNLLRRSARSMESMKSQVVACVARFSAPIRHKTQTREFTKQLLAPKPSYPLSSPTLSHPTTSLTPHSPAGSPNQNPSPFSPCAESMGPAILPVSRSSRTAKHHGPLQPSLPPLILFVPPPLLLSQLSSLEAYQSTCSLVTTQRLLPQ